MSIIHVRRIRCGHNWGQSARLERTKIPARAQLMNPFIDENLRADAAIFGCMAVMNADEPDDDHKAPSGAATIAIRIVTRWIK